MPPISYVRPTPQMQVTPGHRYVDTDCTIRIPYVVGWQRGSSLKEMIGSMQSCFGQSPPVEAKRASAPSPAPSRPHRQAPSPAPSQSPSFRRADPPPYNPSGGAAAGGGHTSGHYGSGSASADAIKHRANEALKSAFGRVQSKLLGEVAAMQQLQADLKLREQRRAREQ